MPDLVVRRPSLPSLGLSPKQPGLASEALPHHSAATASLENDNYNYGGPEQLAAMFSVSDESEGSSSPGSGASPRDQEEEKTRGRLALAVDRVRSGIHSTSGFQRF